jgi:flagellar biosynthesis/type III secretory pathway protein FliH
MAGNGKCQGLTVKGFPCRGSATASGYCPVHTPGLAPVVAEARRRGGYNRANAKRLRRLLEESALWPVFEAAMDAFVRLEQGELSPQAAVAASHLLKIALEAVATALKLVAKEEGAAPQALPSITPETQEERWARLVARATQICEEATAAGAPLELSEGEEREAQLIAKATQILERVWPSKPKTAPSALPTEASHAPSVGARAVLHGRP